MEAVSVSEFRSNIKKYLDIAKEEKLVVYRNKSESFIITPLNKLPKKVHLLSLSQKKAIDEALKDVANGNVHSHEAVMAQTRERYPHLFVK